jgi:hypothetical protein
MPYYYSEAAAADGRIHKRILKAFDEKDADRQLRRLGLHPMFIESTQKLREKKQEKALHTRHIVRNTICIVAAISLVCGIAGYLVLLDLKADQSGVPSGIVAYASDINYGDTPVERRFASHVDELLETNFPGCFRNVTVKKKSVMLIYENEERERLESGVEESILTMLTRGFQREFNTRRCEVFFVRHERTIASARYQDGKVITSFE